jgi:hypothetical protein
MKIIYENKQDLKEGLDDALLDKITTIANGLAKDLSKRLVASDATFSAISGRTSVEEKEVDGFDSFVVTIPLRVTPHFSIAYLVKAGDKFSISFSRMLKQIGVNIVRLWNSSATITSNNTLSFHLVFNKKTWND